MSSRVLIIEDDEKIFEVINANVDELSLSLDWEPDGLAGLDLALSENYCLILLDLMLPGLGGMEVCRRIREAGSRVPIIMLTAREDELSKVMGIELGADDYIQKPFSVVELFARIRSVLRRSQAAEISSNRIAIESDRNSGEVIAAELRINLETRRVWLTDKEIKLSVIEFDLLTFLAKNPGRTFSREQILDAIWGSSTAATKHTINTQVNRIRQKIEKDLSKPRFIKTVWGVGYRFAELEEL